MSGAVYFLNDYPMDVARARWRDGDYPGHHLWGMNLVEEHGWAVEYSAAPGDVPPTWMRRLRIDAATRFAARLALRPPRQPNVYCGSLPSYRLLGLLKSVGVFRRRVVVLVHHPVRPNPVHRRALDAADAIFFLNDFAREHTLLEMPGLAARSHVVGWYVDTGFYDAEVVAFPEEAFNPKLIVAAGKEQRDYDSLVRGVTMIDDPNLRVEIYCSEETAPSVTDPRVAVHVGPSHGSSISYRDLLQRYRAAAAVAIPLQPVHRTLGLTSVFDALACRRALLVTRHASIEVPVAGEDMGIIVEPHDPAGWSAAITTILANPAYARDMGARGRAYAERALSPQRYGAMLSALFHRYFAVQPPLGRNEGS